MHPRHAAGNKKCRDISAAGLTQGALYNHVVVVSKPWRQHAVIQRGLKLSIVSCGHAIGALGAWTDGTGVVGADTTSGRLSTVVAPSDGSDASFFTEKSTTAISIVHVVLPALVVGLAGRHTRRARSAWRNEQAVGQVGNTVLSSIAVDGDIGICCSAEGDTLTRADVCSTQKTRCIKQNKQHRVKHPRCMLTAQYPHDLHKAAVPYCADSYCNVNVSCTNCQCQLHRHSQYWALTARCRARLHRQC